MISIILVIEFLYVIITILGLVAIMLGIGWVVNEIADFLYMRKLSKGERLKWKSIKDEVKQIKSTEGKQLTDEELKNRGNKDKTYIVK